MKGILEYSSQLYAMHYTDIEAVGLNSRKDSENRFFYSYLTHSVQPLIGLWLGKWSQMDFCKVVLSEMIFSKILNIWP